MTEPDTAAFLLPAHRSEEIFREHIVPTLLANARPQINPVMIVLTAQPGAGKSTLARDIQAGFPDDARPVAVDVDSFRPFYPGYLRLRQEHGWMVDDLVQADARRWLDKALTYLADRGANIIAEHGLRDWQVTDDLLDRFTSPHGPRRSYRVEAALLATGEAQSRLGMLERYQAGFERVGLGRYVADEVHDARYRHLLQAADWLDADPRVSTIAVYRRGVAAPVHRNDRGPDGRWARTVATRDAVTAERNRPWSLVESRAFLRLHHSLTARMAADWQDALARVRDAAVPLLDPSADVPSHDKPAVTFGRYQIVSIAHLDTIRTILMDWPTVEVGVLDLDARPAQPPWIPEHLQEFYRGCEANTAPAKNPMTAQERASFWQATIAEAGLEERVTVRIIARPEIDPEAFNRQYPADRVGLVFPTASGEGFDLIRNASFAEILQRPVFAVDPPLEYHTSDIRTAFRAGNDAWKNGFAPGGLQAFLAVDGPHRLLGEATAAESSAGEHAAHSTMHAFPPLRRVTPHGTTITPPAANPANPSHRPGRGRP